MKKKAPGTWLTLNARYHIDADTDPHALLDDASLLLDGARGMAQCLSDKLADMNEADVPNLAPALWGVATLIEMGRRNAHEAQVVLSKKK